MAVSEHVWIYDEEARATRCARCKLLQGHERTVCRALEETISVTANDRQVNGDHYKSKAIQPWDFIAANNLGYFEGNAVKYVSRWRDKGGVEDLRKAIHYIEKLISIETGKDV